jgi:hypothetical protein
MPQVKVEQHCSRDRGEGIISFQGCRPAWEIHCLQRRSCEVISLLKIIARASTVPRCIAAVLFVGK